MKYISQMLRILIVKSEARSNITQNGSKCPVIVISSHILVHLSQKVEKSRKSPKVKPDRTSLKSEAGVGWQNAYRDRMPRSYSEV